MSMLAGGGALPRRSGRWPLKFSFRFDIQNPSPRFIGDGFFFGLTQVLETA
jgi:hypothetical protein